MYLSLSSRKAQPRGSFESTKTGILGPRASAIFPASDHFVEMTKLGAWAKIGAFLRSRHSKALEHRIGKSGPRRQQRPRPAGRGLHERDPGDRGQQRRRKESPSAKRVDRDAALIDPCAQQGESKEPTRHRPMRLAAAAPKRRQGEQDNRRQTEAKKKQAAVVPPNGGTRSPCPRQEARISKG